MAECNPELWKLKNIKEALKVKLLSMVRKGKSLFLYFKEEKDGIKKQKTCLLTL